MRRGWSRADAIVAVGLGALTWLVRGIDRGRDLHTWDSGLLAAGILSFDFLAGQPHPPFYPLTIALGKVLAPAVGPAMALVWLSVVASGVMVAVTYVLARRWLPRAWAFMAPAFLLMSPIAHANGIASLSYALEGAMVAVVGLAAWDARTRPASWRWAGLALAASIAVGIRPSSLFFVVPVLLWSVWGSWPGLRIAVATGVPVTFAWGISMLLAGGGWQAFRAVNGHQTEVYLLHDPVWRAGWSGVATHIDVLVGHLTAEGPWLLLLAALGIIMCCALRPGPATWFWLAWTLPPALFFIFVYDGWPIQPDGYLMALWPQVAVGAAGLLAAAHGFTWRHPDLGPRALAKVAIAALVVMPFTWVDEVAEATEPLRAAEDWSASWADVGDVLPPSDTALLTFYGWNYAKIHHPEYLTWAVQPWVDEQGVLQIQVAQSQHGRDDVPFYANLLNGHDDPRHPIPDHIKRVVLFQGHPVAGEPALVADQITLHNATLPSGRTVSYFFTDGLATIESAFLWEEP